MRGPCEQERSRERPRLAFRPELLRLPNERAGTYADILPFHPLARREAGPVLLAGPARTPTPASEPTPHPSHRTTVTRATAHAGRSFTHSTRISKFLLHVAQTKLGRAGCWGPPSVSTPGRDAAYSSARRDHWEKPSKEYLEPSPSLLATARGSTVISK